MILSTLLAHLKVVAYVVSGFAASRIWFAKQIKVGKAVLKQYEDELTAAMRKLEKSAVAEVKKVESKM